MKSYLLNRQQKVRFQNESSDYGKITTGVPQGTILGPLLFILYINDLLRDMPKDNILSYADDTVLIVSEDSWSAAQDNMNKLLNNVADWLGLNKLSLNIQKTMYITFRNYSNSVPETFNIAIQNQKIRRVMACKYLGIHFDYNMRWDKHIEYVYSKTKYLIFVLSKLKKIMYTNTLMTMYYAFFHSYINYGIIA